MSEELEEGFKKPIDNDFLEESNNYKKNKGTTQHAIYYLLLIILLIVSSMYGFHSRQKLEDVTDRYNNSVCFLNGTVEISPIPIEGKENFHYLNIEKCNEYSKSYCWLYENETLKTDMPFISQEFRKYNEILKFVTMFDLKK